MYELHNGDITTVWQSDEGAWQQSCEYHRLNQELMLDWISGFKFFLSHINSSSSQRSPASCQHLPARRRGVIYRCSLTVQSWDSRDGYSCRRKDNNKTIWFAERRRRRSSDGSSGGSTYRHMLGATRRTHHLLGRHSWSLTNLITIIIFQLKSSFSLVNESNKRVITRKQD